MIKCVTMYICNGTLMIICVYMYMAGWWILIGMNMYKVWLIGNMCIYVYGWMMDTNRYMYNMYKVWLIGNNKHQYAYSEILFCWEYVFKHLKIMTFNQNHVLFVNSQNYRCMEEMQFISWTVNLRSIWIWTKNYYYLTCLYSQSPVFANQMNKNNDWFG